MDDTPILFINLDDAPGRRVNMERQLARFLPGNPVHRVAAVDGRRWTDADRAAVPLTTQARFHLRFPHRALGQAEMEGWGAPGCYLSHMQCWRWIGASPAPVALVLEDDACLNARFVTAWRGALATLRQHPEDWDLLMLGYTGAQGTRRVTLRGVRLEQFTETGGGSFLGTHGYLVTPRGAAMLLRSALPMEVQVDRYMGLLAQVDALRLYLFESIVWQCLRDVEQSIDPAPPPGARRSGGASTATDGSPRSAPANACER